jgi:hypothetical protein
VRLVFAPEQAIAFFGGDVDNFEFPRFNLDVAFFRAYENGQPARVQHFLRLASQTPQEGDLVFVSGHPGRTSRLLTVAELKHQRDVVLPRQLAQLKRREVLLHNWSERSAENARRANRALLGVQNGRKALDGRLAGLLDPILFQSKVTGEVAFKERLQPAGDHPRAVGAFERIATAMDTLSTLLTRHDLLERGEAFRCESFPIARTLLRAGDEFPKADGERLEEYSEAGRVSLELTLFSPRPIYEDLERLTLTDSLTQLAAELGADDPLVQKVLAGQSPKERAAELLRTTRVRDLAFRRQLYDGGKAAVDAANDPLIELARMVDTEARTLREAVDAQHEIRQQAHAVLAAARNTFTGTEGYPDATGTLRLSFGAIRGYQEPNGDVPAFTTLAGLYQRAADMDGRPPFDLPNAWQKRRRHLDLDTPFNFVSTCDIIGGNSGSPVVNRAGEFVGIIFDGNLAGLPWDYAFNDEQGRAIAVDAAAILEALKNVYGAKELVRELRRERK